MKLYLVITLILVWRLALAQDTLCYSNGSVSVIKSVWKDGKRNVHLFDLVGKRTFTLEEVNLSHRSLAKFQYYSNGGVKEVVIHTNPGASRYHYKTVIRFDSTNHPLTKREEKTPLDKPEEFGGEIWFWNKKTNRWIKQEVISCQPYLQRQLLSQYFQKTNFMNRRICERVQRTRQSLNKKRDIHSMQKTWYGLRVVLYLAFDKRAVGYALGSCLSTAFHFALYQ